MKTLMHKLTTTALFLTLTLGSSLALAKQPGKGQGPHHGEKRLERICQKLTCTAQQREDLQKIGEKLKAQRKSEGPQVKQLKKQIAEEFRKPNLNKIELNRLFLELERHHSAMKVRMQEAMVEIHRVLTPEQRNQVADMMERRGAGVFFGWGHRKKHGPKKQENTK